MKTKKCLKCNNVLPLESSSFPKRSNVNDGFGPYCRECLRAKGRQYYEETKHKRHIVKPKSDIRSQSWVKIKEATSAALQDKPYLSNSLIAEAVGASYELVLKTRESLESQGIIPIAEELLARDGRWRVRHFSTKQLKKQFGERELIYFIQIETQVGPGPIKIGYSKRVDQRIRDLSTGLPYNVSLLLVIPGGRELENKLHKQFFEFNIKGEWFQPAPAIMTYIEAHKDELNNNEWETWKGHMQEINSVQATKRKSHYKVQKPTKPNLYAVEGKKQCVRCKEILDLNEFNKNVARADNKNDYCRKCIKARKNQLAGTCPKT